MSAAERAPCDGPDPRCQNWMSAVPKPQGILSAEACGRIDREVAKYPADQKQSAVIAALAIAQDQHGWLPEETISAVADYLDMPAIAVYEVATFYNMYDLRRWAAAS